MFLFSRSCTRRFSSVASHLAANLRNPRIPAYSLRLFNSGETRNTNEIVSDISKDQSTKTDKLELNNVLPVPNESWSKETIELYNELSNGTWVQVPSNFYTGKYHTFSTSVDQYGKRLFDFFIFLNKSEKRLKLVCQFGPSTMGPKGFVHGGAIAAILDVVTAHLSNKVIDDPALTANLSVDFKMPVPMEITVLCEGHVESIQGRKIYSYGEMRSHDGTQLYATAKCLCVTPDMKK